MSYCDDDDEAPFFFELEVDDEISFKAPQKAAPRIETSRSSFAMPQFSMRNLVTSSELFKSSEADNCYDKENNPRSTLSCNTAEKPKLPPSSAEKLMRYSVDSAVSFIENFSSLIPRDLPSFSTIAEGADESVEDPNAEDCDLSEAEICEFRCAGDVDQMMKRKLTDTEFEFRLGSTNVKYGNDNYGLAPLIDTASNNISIDSKHSVLHENDNNNDINSTFEDTLSKSQSCESFNTATENVTVTVEKQNDNVNVGSVCSENEESLVPIEDQVEVKVVPTVTQDKDIKPVGSLTAAPVLSRRMSMMKVIGDRRNAREERKEVEEGVKKESKFSITADNDTKKKEVEVKEITVVSAAVPVVSDIIAMDKDKKDKESDEMRSNENDTTIMKCEIRKVLVSEDKITSTSTTDNQIVIVKIEGHVVEEKKDVEEEVERTEVEAEAEVVMKFEEMKVSLNTEEPVITKICHDIKQNSNDKLNAGVPSNDTAAAEGTDLVVLSSEVVTVNDTLTLPSTAQVEDKVEVEVEDPEGKISDVCSCDTTICLAINPHVHFLEGGAEVMDGVARSSYKLKEIIESVARSAHKIKRSEIAKALAEEENDVVECSSEATWMSTESTSEVVEEEVENEVVTAVEVKKEKEVEKEVEKSSPVIKAVKEVQKEYKEEAEKRKSFAPASPCTLNKGMRTEKEVEIEEEEEEEVEVMNSPRTTSSPIAADGLTEEEREELAALIAEEESLMAEIDENERQNEIEDEKMMTLTEHTDVNDDVDVQVEVETLSVPVKSDGQGSDIHDIEVEEISNEVEEVMITVEKFEVEKDETQNKEAKKDTEEKEEKEEKSILEETETGKKLNVLSIPNTEPSLSLYEYSPKSVKSLTPIFSRLTQPVLKTEIVANKIDTKNEPIPLFSAVPIGCKIENTEKDDEWTLDLLASSPMPIKQDQRRQSVINDSIPTDTDFIRAAQMIEDEAEKENKNKVSSATFVVDMVLDNDQCDDDKENIEIQMKNEKNSVNEKENEIKYENETDKMNRIENEKLVERNIHRVSLIVNTISSLSPSPMSVGLGMSPMTGTITPTTQMTQERYSRSEVDVAVQTAVREAEIFFAESEKERKDIEKFLLSRADAAEENIKLLTEKMKEKDKEVVIAKDSASLSSTQSRALAHRLQTIESEMESLQQARTSEILSVKNFYTQNMESLKIKNEEEKVILMRETDLKILMKEESVKKQIKEYILIQQDHAKEIVSAVDAAKEKVYAKAKVQFEAGNKEFLRLKSLLKESKAECENAVRLSDSLTIQLGDTRQSMEIETKKVADGVKRSNHLKSLLVSLVEAVQKLKSGSQVSTTVRDDQAAEEAAVVTAKDIIKATSKEMAELSEGKSSLQASSTVLERTLQRMEGELIACKNAGEKNSDKVALSSALLAKTKIELQDVIKERDNQMTALATLLAKGDTGNSSSSNSAEVQELSERCTNLRKMNDELLGMLEKMYEEQAKK